ncbi:MAG: DUF456 domain-containing protein [Phycisphaerae bacterium]|nr:DUF456 domain-containing protein [Phycisphaerae bacterium]NNF42490.1 DUF456 domain-containing protein [Phycisphaerales bacterium]
MELTLIIIVGVLFAIISFACVLSVVVGLPGAWLILALALIIELTDTLYLEGVAQTFPWWMLIAGGVLATIGEILEFGAGALGAKHAGSSRRGMVGALIGGIVGALAGLPIPIPLVGSLIGAVIGTFLGAMVAELSHPDRTMPQTLRPATGATIGRVLGTLSKVPIAVAIWAALVVAAFWP